MNLLVSFIFSTAEHEFILVFPPLLSTLSTHRLDRRRSFYVHIEDDGKRQQMIYRN